MTINSIYFNPRYPGSCHNTVSAHMGADEPFVNENSVVKSDKDGSYHVVGLQTGRRVSPSVDRLFTQLMNIENIKTISIQADESSCGAQVLFVLSEIGGLNKKVLERTERSIYDVCFNHRDQTYAYA